MRCERDFPSRENYFWLTLGSENFGKIFGKTWEIVRKNLGNCSKKLGKLLHKI